MFTGWLTIFRISRFVLPVSSVTLQALGLATSSKCVGISYWKTGHSMDP